MSVKVLIKRDTVDNFKTKNFIPREYELVAAYGTDTEEVIYKLGDGKTYWADLKEITKISELDKFIFYVASTSVSGTEVKHSKVCKGPEIYLNPFMAEEVLNDLGNEPKNLNAEKLIETVNKFITDDKKAIY